MNATADRLEFAPPPPPGFLRAGVIAVTAHLLLLLALTWGVAWKRDVQVVSAQAELWASVPQQAAPKLVATPPAPPVVKLAPPPPTPQPRQAEIALEREKKKLAEDKKQQLDLERQKKLEAQKKLDALKKQQAAQAQQTQQALEDAKLKALREENMRRITGLAGASGAPTATGTAPRSSGPSATYGGKIIARVRPNIVFTEDLPGNPVADVEVRAAPDGTIVAAKVVKSSGFKSWDDAVVKALNKTETLPKDTDGRVPSVLVISFRPKD